MLLEFFVNKNSLSFIPSKGDYSYCEGKIKNSEFSLIEPSTYVNNSGTAAADLIDRYKIDLSEFLVIHDDINLPVAKLKVTLSGGDGGHNGINSIIYHLASDQFPRLKVGIGNSFDKGSMADFVLSDFNNEEKKLLEKSFLTACSLIEEFIYGGNKQMLNANSKIIGTEKDSNNGINNKAQDTNIT